MDNKRLTEIESRKVEIRSALQSDEEVDLEALKTELEKLNDEKKQIEERAALAAKINVNSVKTDVIEKPEVRTEMENDSKIS